jgi:hypothetical protein
MTKKPPQNTNFTIRNSTAEFLMFTADSRVDGMEVRYHNETVWLSQKMMAVLFDCSTDNISLHLKNIVKEHELDKNSVAEEFLVTASDLDLAEERAKRKILNESEISKNK